MFDLLVKSHYLDNEHWHFCPSCEKSYLHDDRSNIRCNEFIELCWTYKLRKSCHTKATS